MNAYHLLLRITFNGRTYRGVEWLTSRNRDCAILNERLTALRRSELDGI
jgi:hypothetical protein